MKWYSALLLDQCLIQSSAFSRRTCRDPQIVCRESLNWSSPADPSPWRLGSPAEEGEDCNRQRGWWTPEEHGPPNEARSQGLAETKAASTRSVWVFTWFSGYMLLLVALGLWDSYQWERVLSPTLLPTLDTLFFPLSCLASRGWL